MELLQTVYTSKHSGWSQYNCTVTVSGRVDVYTQYTQPLLRKFLADRSLHRLGQLVINITYNTVKEKRYIGMSVNVAVVRSSQSVIEVDYWHEHWLQIKYSKQYAEWGQYHTQYYQGYKYIIELFKSCRGKTVKNRTKQAGAELCQAQFSFG